jgi:signal transduction histidine kinase
MASNSEGEWNEPGDVREFSIQPMFYQTGWFYALALTALGLAVWGAWVLRLRQVRRQFSMLIGERARLSREIHDTLLQSLVGVALQFDSIANDIESLSPKAKNRFVRMRKQVEEYIREARQSIWDLRSPKLQRADLVTALRETCEQATADRGVALEFAVTGTPHRCPPKIEEQVLRIGQEAVTNAVRHADPNQVRIELHYDSSALTLRVADDGRGFDPLETLTDHYGLVSMRERTEDVGGAFLLTSDLGRGTEVQAVIPLAEHV